jgi:hypothetical protein
MAIEGLEEHKSETGTRGSIILGVITSASHNKLEMKAETVTPKTSRFTPFSKTPRAPSCSAAVRTGEITAR